MDQQLVQRTRYLLQTRFRRLRNASAGNFEIVCEQVLAWLDNHPILGGIMAHLSNTEGEHHAEVQRISAAEDMPASRYYVLAIGRRDKRHETEPDFKGYTCKTIEEHASACLEILRATVKRPKLEFYDLLATYISQEEHGQRTNRDTLAVFKDLVARDLYEYLDERLDTINAVNGLLHKYKQSVEWFQRAYLQQIIQVGYDDRRGERALAIHLQQYIFDQGVEFMVEPASVSGEVDLLLRDSSGAYTVIDAKYIKSEATQAHIVRKIAEGFNQVARYCNDYNQSEGFLAVFNSADVSILIDVDQIGGFKYFKVGGSVIYYIEINIAQRASASKSGKSKQVTISREELIQEFETIDHKQI